VLGDEAARFVADEEWGRKFLGEPEMLGVERLDDSAVVLRISLRVRPADRWAVRREFLRRVKRRFDRDGISIPYPHVTVVGDPPSGASAPPDPGGQD
jgi:small-conductance mechanosensitive channel